MNATAINLEFGDVSVIVAAKDAKALARAFHYLCITEPPHLDKLTDVEIHPSAPFTLPKRDSAGRYSPKTGHFGQHEPR